MGLLDDVWNVFSGTGQVIGSGVGTVAGTIGTVGSQTFSTLGATAYGLGAGAYGLGTTIVEGAGEVIVGLPEIGERAKPLVEVLGQAYGVYQSYEQAKAAKEAAKKAGTPISGTSTSPTIISVPGVSSGGGAAYVPMTEDERMLYEAQQQSQSDLGRFLMYGGLAFLAYKVLSQ